MAPFIGQNIGEDQKKKENGLRCKTSWFSVRKYVMTKKRKWVFGLKKPKWCHPKMVTPGRAAPPSDATEKAQTLKLLQTENS